MERLTERLKGQAWCAGDCTGITDDCECKHLHKMRDKLAEYEDLEEQGLLLRLPCKVGDRIYFIDDGEIYWDSVNAIELRKEKGEFVFCIGFMDYRKDDFGKIVFPTKAEAEKALAELK